MRAVIDVLYRYRVYCIAPPAILLAVITVLGSLFPGAIARPVRLSVVIVAMLLMLAGFTLSLAGARLAPAPPARTVVPPVSGRWLALNSPSTRVPSHGVRAYGQAYAIDLVLEPEDGSRPAFGGANPTRSPAEYPAFGAPVAAMIDGIVVRSVDRQRDHGARSNLLGLLYFFAEGAVRELGGSRRILGNHVTIRGDDGAYALVAHLQRGSVRARVGERVRAGEVIGACGNTGNSTEPHVHAQLMDRASPTVAHGLPMRFLRPGGAEGDGGVGGPGAAVSDELPGNGEYLRER